ncbi:hypothetical protein FRACYDRAFT_247470 [Fragilariopsis cylindrus CCMP1102]|uniref:BTB domain-containing protein n=1 Tax=Fragilariopsis cylindrus CCMP1102 TaxID=635003 RepID=A0A1E7EX41_9STRA|nr:hypothetical protein FRACYDRAFT_247470 [Fragilariopsis cylindrus CCMP1102]|eukprot:OEU10399.1 hypothetical protein FRACYDRAFT_247470 [Fragilariopsis cylindrus CCMP1102]
MTNESKNRKLEEEHEMGDNEEERKRNSLRCAVANLKVIVGGELQPTKVFWHYREVLASQSRYVDTLLSLPLAAAVAASKQNDSDEESKAANVTEIEFPDISPSQWKRMMKFLTDQKAAWDMNKKDAIELIILYDKYDFTQGIEVCDRVLSSIFYKDSLEFKEHEMGDNEEERKRNSLRCAVANLKVIVGGEQGDGGGKPTTKKVFWHYTTVLASQSRYVDALLASKKNDSYGESTAANFTEITFPDISPSQWKRMMKFLTDQKAAWDMNKKDAIELIILYDKYDFTQGIEVCDRVLSSIFYKDSLEFKERINDLDLFDRCIDVVVLSHEKNLTETMENARYWLYDFLCDGYDPELVILTVDHVRKLVPVIDFYKEDREGFSLLFAIEERLSKKGIDVLNPMFPDFFVSQIQLIAARNTALKLVNEITIGNCGGNVSGDYNPRTNYDYGIDGTCIYYKGIAPDWGDVWLKKNEVGDWTISEDLRLRGGVVPVFICKGSRSATLPPKKGWERTDGRGNGKLPVISYYHKSSSVRTEIDI